jgi:branched-chain amino acid transport system permease protein
VVLAVLLAATVAVANLRRNPTGLRWLAVRANERAAAAAGVDVRAVKITAFGISSAIASIAGVLYGYNFSSVSASRFTALAALALLGFAYVGGITAVSGAMFAGVLSTEALVPHALDTWFGISGTWALLVAGISLVVTLVRNPDGIAGARARAALARRRSTLPPRTSPDVPGAEPAPAQAAAGSR